MKKIKLLLAALAAMVSLGVSAWDGSEGKVYLQNVGSGLWWGAGNDWGTRASLVQHPEYVTLHLNDGKYRLESQVSNGGSAIYFNGDYMDNASPVDLTITEVSTGIYTIANGETYYGYDGAAIGSIAGCVLGKGVDSSTDNGKWRIFTQDEMMANLEAATEENPVDATFLILDQSFGRNNRNTTFTKNKSLSGAWSMSASNLDKAGNDANQCVESYHAIFTLSQVLNNVPNGEYELTVQGFYRQDGSDNTHLPIFYINEGTATFPLKTGSENSMTGASNSFTNGNYAINPIHVTVGDGTITLGAKLEGNTNLWCIFDNFTLKYFGIDLSAYESQIATLRSTLTALVEEPMNSTALSTANTALSETESVTQTQTAMEAAIAQLNTAIAAANTSIANYVAAKAYLDACNGLDEAGRTSYTSNETVVAVQAAYSDRSLEALTDEQKTALDAAIIVAAKAQTTPGTDWTLAIVNPSFETGDFTGWTNNNMALQTNASFSKDGNVYCEHWQPNGTFGVSQKVTAMPAGVYRLTVKAKTRGVSSGKVFAGGIEVATKIADEVNTYTVEFACDANADITFGFEGTGTGAGSSWLALDDFHLTLVSAGLPDVEAVTGKMNAEVATAQTTAIETYNANKTVANYNAASAAIAAAETSKAAYEKAATALADANALKDAHNFATADATTTFAEAIAAVQAKYDEGTLTNDEANAGGNLGTMVTGWHGGNNTPAATYLRDGFALGDFAADPALHVNTWSTEGDTDGSNFSVPFYESWTADANSLPESKLTGTISDLPNGLYNVSVWVRVAAKTGVAANAAAGITMDVNNGTVVDVTEGDVIGETQRSIATYEAEGLVKDGKLTLNFNIAADANISWLAFKNVKYTKVRDLTPEEAAVTPADLSLDATSTVYKGKTVTLVPTSSTEGASIEGYLNWSSDNESVATVANGVVTGVAYGTANITVTSTLNGEATATCEVTVTAPLITEAVNLDFAEGPVVENHIRTYAKDKTGTDVAQMQEVTGWTIVENGDAKAAGVMAYGSSYGMGSNSSDFYAPATNPNGEAIGNVFGMVGVWTASVQYVQNVKLPAGAYTITVPVYRNGGGSALSKNLIGVVLDDATEYLAKTTTYTSGSWTTETIKFNIASETYGKLSIGLNAPNQGSANSQRLWIDGFTVTYEPFATTEEIAALNGAIEAAEAYTLGFEVGEYAPYMNAAALQALAAAKALDTENPVSQSAVTGATAALNGATWTANAEELNAVYDGTFAAAEADGAPAGWTMSNSTLGGATHSRAFVGDNRLSEFNETNSAFFIRFDGTYSDRGSMYYYGNTAGYTMPLKAGVTYYVKADIACWGSENKTQRMNITGPEGFSAKSQDVTLTSRADNADNDPQQFLIVFQATVDGNYVISFQTPGNDDNKHNAVVSNIELKKATPATLKISDALYATFVAPFAVTIPDGVTAYTVGEPDNDLLTLTEVTTTIPANHPVVLQSEDEVEATTVYGYATPVAEPKAGILTGVYEATAAPVGSYVLQKQEDKVAFYKVVEDNQPTVGANRAYLTAPANVDVKAFFFDEATAIKSVFDGVAAGNIYDMAGRKVSKMQKGGVYVVNGKKVVIK